MKNKNEKKKFSIVALLAIVMVAFLSLSIYTIISNQDSVYSRAADEVAGDNFRFTSSTSVILTGNSKYRVPLFYRIVNATTNMPIFCVWHNVGIISYGDIINEETGEKLPDTDQEKYLYVKNGEIDDYGLLYLLNADVAAPQGTVSGHEEEVKTWIRQTAIWGYLHRFNNRTLTGSFISASTGDVVTSLQVNNLTNEELEGIAGSNVLNLVTNLGHGDSTKIYEGAALASSALGTNGDNTVVGKLIAKASTASEAKGIAIQYTDPTKTEDGAYYQTEVTVKSSPYEDALTKYSLRISGIEGAEVVKKDGGELTLTDINPAEVPSFYIRVPVDKVTDETKTINLEVDGVVDVLNGYYYQDNLKDHPELGVTGSLQRVITVTGRPRNVSSSLPIDFVPVSDTGMSAAQTIYFVGLIVLLCGIGIVYANTKPVENKQ